MNQDLSIVSLVLHASLVVQIVMAGLMIVSLASWTVIFGKIFGLKRVRGRNEGFEREFWSGRSLTEMVGAMRRDFPSSGEINFRVTDLPSVVRRVETALAPEARSTDRTDGLSLDFGDWRLNLRASNTEPLLRLNVEARGDAGLVASGVARVTALIEG